MPKNALCRKEFTNKDLGLQVRTIANEDGSISISAEDTAIGFGWIQIKNGKIYVRWETLNGYCEELGFSQQVGKDDYIPESLFYRLGMKANNKVADAFQNWLAMEVIPSIRKTGSYSTGQSMSMEDIIIYQMQQSKLMKEQLEKTQTVAIEAKATAEQATKQMEAVRDAMLLDHDSWRKECTSLINKIAQARGDDYSSAHREAYQLTEQRGKANLKQRITNKKHRLRDEGASKSKVDKVKAIDVIAEDTRLKQIYIAVVKDMAIKYGVA